MTSETVRFALDKESDYKGKVITDFIPLKYSGYAFSDRIDAHSDPCPGDSQGMDEWVLNHLPFGTEEQKKKFLDTLIKDQLVADSKKKRDKTIKKLHKESKESSSAPSLIRSSVKEQTKTKWREEDSGSL